MKVLLTSTSFQDTPGKHHNALAKTGWEILKMRGPIKEKELLEVIDEVDGVICGDDEYTKAVIQKGINAKLKAISKYGVGLDSIDLNAAKEAGIKVVNCPGVNQNAVAEHVFGLLLTFFRHIHEQNEIVQKSQWKRLVGSELSDKKLGIFGLGSVGKELAKKARAWGIEVYVVDKYLNQDFVNDYKLIEVDSIEELVSKVDILSLHTPLSKENKHIISDDLIQNHVKKGLTIVNTARGKLVDNRAIIKGIESKKIKGYLADVLEEEPIVKNHPFIGIPQIILTPHVGSRTFESVAKQGTMAVNNLLQLIGN